jgi:hypothetical protein
VAGLQVDQNVGQNLPGKTEKKPQPGMKPHLELGIKVDERLTHELDSMRREVVFVAVILDNLILIQTKHWKHRLTFT